ncbi:MAG: type II secretion system F family protein [Candidatus Parvarchaeota archaeon]|nr:type II secretion system F family protein [Candidatus Parvarchaeota archaeon]MCW1295746.1 type II secretion system F family protein [Candidatus Parvarchaeum tengchongense]MCW1299209.1 type II secretion system F family protein [Candidatus Parvarchaeum tengchongense]MCW1311821.1 type II secretion system F family protein [Candidatus Parvarchaeum tengchongense]
MKQNSTHKDIRSSLAHLLPKRLTIPLKEEFIYAQMGGEDLDQTIGSVAILLIIGAVVGAVLVFHFLHSPLYAIGAVLGIFFGGIILVRSMLSMFADSIAAKIEKVLPDMLLLMAANLRAGMIPENSFIASMKPEFGKLNYLLNKAAIETQAGKNFSEALLEMNDMTNSEFFKDSVRIISEGIRSGAELHLILENLASNLLQNESIRNDMRAQVKSYSLFIFIAATLAAPLLYGVSSFLIGILDQVGATTNTGNAAANLPSGTLGLFSGFSLPHISVTLVIAIATINVIITTASSALLGGILNTGKAKNGLKNIPVYVVIGLGIFFMVRIGVSTLFASSSLTSGVSSGF